MTNKYLAKFQSPRAITRPKIIGAERNVNLICNSSLYNLKKSMVKTVKYFLNVKYCNKWEKLQKNDYCQSTFIRWHTFSRFLQNAVIHGFLNSWFQTLQSMGKLYFIGF